MSRSLNIVIGSTMLAIFLLAGCGNESEATKEASGANGNQEMKQNGGQGFAGEELTDAQIIEMAEQAGIDTEGKSIEEIQEELREAMPEMGKGGGKLNEDDVKK